MSAPATEATAGGSARRFVALPLPQVVRDGVASALPPRDTGSARGLRWARPDGWHVTLAFLGKLADAQVGAVAEAIADGVASVDPVPDRLRVDGAGRFGRKVLWVGIDDEPSGSLVALAEAIREEIAGLGVAIDRKPLSPHVTLARAGRRAVAAADVEACRPPADSLTWRPNAVELWRSRLGEGPARYEVEATVPFDDPTT